ncbi:MAG: hypothetical protein R2795_26530 [Saprospiraceae bacterium]
MEENLTNSNWTITWFEDSGDDDTHYFTGYVFDFCRQRGIDSRQRQQPVCRGMEY